MRVDELLRVLRGAIQSVIPWVEAAGIKWRTGEAYDDWDNIATALYKNIVCSTLVGDVLDEYPIAKYDLMYESYDNLDFIGVVSREHDNTLFAFISFEGRSLPLDVVRVAVLDSRNQMMHSLLLDLQGLEFVYVKHGDNGREIIREIPI